MDKISWPIPVPYRYRADLFVKQAIIGSSFSVERIQLLKLYNTSSLYCVYRNKWGILLPVHKTLYTLILGTTNSYSLQCVLLATLFVLSNLVAMASLHYSLSNLLQPKSIVGFSLANFFDSKLIFKINPFT